jgi:hypothetical protein
MMPLARLVAPVAFAVCVLAGSVVPALAADVVTGTVGTYRMYDQRSDPSTLCTYPVGGSKLTDFMARGPRVDFPYAVGEVGWVEWQAMVQRKTDSGTWKTISKTDPIRRTVTVGFTKTFPTVLVPVAGPSGQARIRLVSRLDWFDQGDHHKGKVRHVVKNYGWDRYQFDAYKGDLDPISFDQIARRSTGSCPNLWTS